MTEANKDAINKTKKYIREGDIIIEINESQIRTRKDFQEVTSGFQTGDVSIFTVVRNSEQYHFFVENL